MSPSVPRAHVTLSFSILCCCMISMVLGTSYDYGFDVTKAHQSKRQSDGIIVTTGMPLNEDGSVPVRPEIRDLQQDVDRWSLYVLALDMLQYTDQSEPTSWFGITSTSHQIRRHICFLSHSNLGSDADFRCLVTLRHTWCAFRAMGWCNANCWERICRLLSP